MRYFGSIITTIFIAVTSSSLAQDDGCTNPNNPAWRLMHQSPVYQQICAEEAQRAQHAAALQQQWQQQQNAKIQAQAQAVSDQKTAMERAKIHGYQLIADFTDLVLDAKQLAGQNKKIEVAGYYKKKGDTERLYASMMDAYNDTNKFIPVLTDDAQRPLRERLLGYLCSNVPTGCAVAVGGHMQMCHYLNTQLANYPPMPCLHVEVEIQ